MSASFNGELPILDGAFRGAMTSNSNRMTSLRPPRAAACKGVDPSTACELGSAPSSIAALNASTSSSLMAECVGIESSVLFTRRLGD
eukprot:CAMPEP_0118943738 /NCGR_PEP_ID=MMETSP1169-20130426/38932_1 /TAXON_ID=36882 /ORGANISM="Pyramimonas obovata, Strain CCMP722" /LENGTH=86 /DNA_ID=CAMNT_0006889061 /DNA_START=100 /DNA_END=360 /DNA_ORIENTATION=-